MKRQLRHLSVILCFAITLVGLMLANVIVPDARFSGSERRSLAAMPVLSRDAVFSGRYFSEFEKYVLDQFAFRDGFRGVKAFSQYTLFQRKDNNQIYIIDRWIHKIEYPLNGNAIRLAGEKFNNILDQYLEDKNVRYAVIPDKNYYTDPAYRYLSMDYDALRDQLAQVVKDIPAIDLFQVLTLDDYYYTDIHWRQERLFDTTNVLLKELGNPIRIAEKEFRHVDLFPFRGSYYGQAALPLKPDTLTYLTSDMLEKAFVYDHQRKVNDSIYNPDLFDGMDPYDVFLSGAKPLLTMINPEAETDRELLLFRDSFGSSIAPLLLSGYAKITLVDLRYLSADHLDDYLDFSTYEDVLFLYGVPILNNSAMLR